MNKIETVAALLTAIEAEDWATANSYLTDDFTFSGAVPQPISAEQWLGVHRALSAAFSNFSFNLQNAREADGQVQGTVHLTGNHTGELRLPIPGIPTVPATGRSLSLPQETFRASFRGDKLTQYEITPVPNGGVMGILQQMGAVVAAH